MMRATEIDRETHRERADRLKEIPELIQMDTRLNLCNKVKRKEN